MTLEGRRVFAAPEAVVLGRLHADLYPLQLETALEDVRTFERFVGGFAGNVGIGIARLGVATAVVSAVGDDGHGRFIRRRLEQEGIDTSSVSEHPTLRTALTFCEVWPPDHFPLTHYRFPTCPDWEIRPADLPFERISRVPILYASGTGLAQEPSRSATLAALSARRTSTRHDPRATIVDLDRRAGYWREPAAYAAQIRAATMLADTVIGSDAEFDAAEITPNEALTLGARRVFVKHGPRGATLLEPGARHESPPARVDVVNGLGAGDAFAAAVGWGLLRGHASERVLAEANAAGAIVASRLSCSDAMPTPSEIASMVTAASLTP